MALLRPLAASAFLILKGGGELPSHYFQPHHLVVAFQPAEGERLPATAQLLARGGRAVWYVDVGARVVGRLPWPPSSPPSSPASWPLPEGAGATEGAGFFGLAPWGEEGTWLVDGVHQRLWRLADGTWEGPWALADRPCAAAALSAQEVLLTTPAHPSYPFTRVGVGGKVLDRLGARRRPPRPGFEEVENTWHVVPLPAGQGWLGAHGYWPLVASWQADGQLRWERQLASPYAAELRRQQERQLARLRVDAQGCVSCELVRATQALAVDEEGAPWVWLGGAGVVDRLTADGRWAETVPFHLEAPAPAAIVVAGDTLLVWDPEGVRTFRLTPNPHRAQVQVVGPTGEPVQGAEVIVVVEGGATFTLTTNSAGVASFPAPPAGAEVIVTASAAGHRRERRVGLAPQVFAEPLQLAKADTVCLAVITASGKKPVPSYRVGVDVAQEGWRAAVEEGETAAVEGEEGPSCHPVPFPYPVAIRVVAEGFALWRRVFHEPPEGVVQVELEPAAWVSLAVVDPDRRPVEGARITFWPKATVRLSARAVGSEAAAVSDAAGEAVVPHLPAGSYLVTAHKEGFLQWQEEWTLETGSHRRRISLSRGAEVVVRVRSAGDGAPVAQAHVTLAGLPDAQQLPECTTAPDGRCRMAGIPSGTFRVSARAPGRAGANRIVSVPPEQGEVSLELFLPRGVRVEGNVRGVEEYPELSLAVAVSAAGQALAKAPVGPDGRFAVEEVQPGAATLVVLDDRGGGILVQRHLLVPNDRPTWAVTVELPPPVRLLGRVVQPGGEPCHGCTVVLSLPAAQVLPPRQRHRTDAHGQFTARLPRAGSWRVEIATPDGEVAYDREWRLEGSTEATFVLEGASLRVRVLDGEGKPVKEAVVQVLAGDQGRWVREGVSDALGRCVFPVVPAGALQVLASAEGAHGRAAARLRPGQRGEVELFLEPRKGLVVRLRELHSGVPLPGSVRFGLETSSGYVVLSQTGDPTGVFHLPIDSGDVRALVVAAPGHAVLTLRGPFRRGQPLEVPVSRRHRSFTLEVREEAPAPCAVSLLDGAGLPLALAVEFPPGPAPLAGRSVMVNFLPEGSYTLVVHPCRGGPWSRPLTLQAGVVPHLVFP